MELSDASPHRLVDEMEERLSPLETAFRLAYWDSQVKATPETEERRTTLELELRRIKGDPEAILQVDKALGEELHENELLRSLQVLRLSLLGNQMDGSLREQLVSLQASVESDFASHRAEVGGRRVTDNEIDEILNSSDDEDERRGAWTASKSVGEVVADRVRELARTRNAAARDLGFADHFAFALELQEIDEGWLFGVLDGVAEQTDEAFRDWKEGLDDRLRNRFGVQELAPWHYADPFFQHLPPDGRVSLDEALFGMDAAELAVRTFGSWGIDITGVRDKSDLYPREQKCQHAFCIDIDRSGSDVRILANVVPGERWVEVMLHESGHAAYDVGLGKRLPYLLRRAAHTFVTEAIAILAGRLVRDPAWLIEIAGVPMEEVLSVQEALRTAEASQSLLFARWALVVTNFERELYKDPDGDLDSIWWDLVHRYQLVARPDGREAPDWAAKIHVATAPAYYHNYLLGEILASQISHHCAEHLGGLIRVEQAGRFLTEEIFKPGSLYRWDVLIEKALGTRLDPAAFIADVTTTPTARRSP